MLPCKSYLFFFLINLFWKCGKIPWFYGIGLLCSENVYLDDPSVNNEVFLITIDHSNIGGNAATNAIKRYSFTFASDRSGGGASKIILLIRHGQMLTKAKKTTWEANKFCASPNLCPRRTIRPRQFCSMDVL